MPEREKLMERINAVRWEQELLRQQGVVRFIGTGEEFDRQFLKALKIQRE